ncbi:uncharacterized protein [Typha latifolia]|uniref:uncharacterized protein isoform X2 n=1 Tax=Typha latifolia TaxID=4733 RepID=UPI003C309030
MVLGSRTNGGGGGAQAISFRVRKTIQSIREIVGDHSEADIYAVLRESNMDPNETAQRLLNQDPFHEVRRRRDKKKENAGFNGFTDVRIRRENRIHMAKPQIPSDQNVRRGGIVQEFRIVKDNRMNQKADKDIESEPESVTLQNHACIKEQIISDSPDKSSIGKVVDQKHSVAKNVETQMATQVLNATSDSSLNQAKDIKSCGEHRPLLPEGTRWRVSSPNKLEQKGVQTKVLSTTSLSSNSMVGLCASSSDPVHVPSPDRSAGTIGAIRREVGVVGVRKQSSDRSSAGTSTSNSFSISVIAKENAPSAEHPAPSKNSRYSQSLPSNNRLYSSSQYNVKLHQQYLGHQKAGQPTMEWKPKPSQNSSNGNRGVSEMARSPPVSDISVGSNQVEVTDVFEKLSQVHIRDQEHVIIPKHLLVPESERAHLIFGTFESGLVSVKAVSSNMQAVGSLKEPNDHCSLSTSASASVGCSEKVSASDQTDPMDSQVRTTRSDSPASNAESVQPLSENKESLHPEEVSNYQQIVMVSNQASSYRLPDTQLLQDSPSLESFKAYSPHTRYGMSFLHTGVEDNVRDQDLALASEAMSSLPTNGIHLSNTMELQQQQSVQQQQQPVAQMYPQVHMAQFPNFMQYRHIFSPVYIPPVAMQNYSSNAAYPQTPNGSNYLLMPGGSTPLNTGSMKYATSSYKPVPAASTIGFGNYSNPTGYPISSGTGRSTTGLEDANGFKYKDSSFYIPNPQAEASDIWIQTPRELPSMQPAPFYNLPAQAGAHAAYVPTHQGHASFDAAGQAPHVQYPGMYHSGQPAQMTSIPSPHHLIHQPVPPGLGGNVGLGVVATPGAQIGAFQRNQLNHLGWTANF